MNTGKQINAMVAVLFLTLIVIGAYTIWDPFRSVDAEEAQLDKSANFGAELFERNCRLCHGDRGQGGVNGGRLPAAVPLDTDALQGIDSDGLFTLAAKQASFKLVTDTVTFGRVGTQMPTWGAQNGGTLNQEQIRQLAILITEGRWDLAEEHADHTDAIATLAAEVEVEDGTFAADETELTVSNAGPFTLGQYIRIGEERLRVLPNQILVERAVDGTTAAEHVLGSQILLDGAPVPRNQQPTLRDGQIVLLGGATASLAEAMTDEDAAITVGDSEGFEEGDIVQVDDERMRVIGTATGLPSTGVVLASEIRREPTEIFVSGPVDFDDGELIRIGLEPMEVEGVSDAGTGVELDESTSADSVVVSVEDARFLRRDYQFRIGDEWMQVIDAISTGQVVDFSFGKAQSIINISGAQGIAEGDLIRVDEELMTVTEVMQQATAELERGVNETSAGAHLSGTELRRFVEVEEGEPVPDTSTGQAISEDLDASGSTATITGIARLNEGDVYTLEGEAVTVTQLLPAVLKVERGVQDTEAAPHARRSTMFVGNNLNVIRGINGTTAADHSAGDEIVMTNVDVQRAVETKPVEHAKNAEIYFGNSMTVARGVLDTEAEDHENGATVRNFPTAPGTPAITGTGTNVCGQLPAPAASTPGPAVTPSGDETPVAVELDDFSVTADPTSGPGGPYLFNVENVGGSLHNFRVIHTDLAEDALPLDGTSVDETAVDVVATSSSNIPGGGTDAVATELDAGNYVLICNVPGHYDLGMHTSFTVQ